MILSGIIHYLSDLEFLPKTCWRFASSCSILWSAQRAWRRRNDEFGLQQRRGRTASAHGRGWSQPEYGNHDAKTDDGAGWRPTITILSRAMNRGGTCRSLRSLNRSPFRKPARLMSRAGSGRDISGRLGGEAGARVVLRIVARD